MQPIFSPSHSNALPSQLNLLNSTNLNFANLASTSISLNSNSIVSSCLNTNFTPNELIVQQNFSKHINFNKPTSTIFSTANEKFFENNFIQTQNYVTLPPPDNWNFTPQQLCDDYLNKTKKTSPSLKLIVNSQNNNFIETNFVNDKCFSTSAFDSIKKNNESFNSQNLNTKKQNNISETVVGSFDRTKKLTNFLYLNETNNQNEFNSNNCLITNLKNDSNNEFLNQSIVPVNQQVIQTDCKFFF